MTESQLDDARLLWKATYATDSFRKVVEVCDHILTQRLDSTSPLYYPLVVSIYVLYARPFLKANFVGKIDAKVVPTEFVSLHRDIMNHRNGAFAHLDAHRTKDTRMGTINQVRFISVGGELTVYATEFRARPLAIEKVKDLASVLQKKMDYHRMKMMRRYQRVVPVKDGEYQVNIERLDQEFVSPVPPMVMKKRG